MIAQLLAAQAAAFLAVLLIVSAAHKARRWQAIRGAAGRLSGMPYRLTAVAAAGAAGAELLAGAALLVPSLRVEGAVATLVVWGGYTVLLLRALLRGQRDIDCGCSFGEARHTLAWFDVGRNLVLMSLVGFVVWSAAVNGVIAVLPSQMLAACALLALYGSLDQVMSLAPLRSGETV